MSPFILYSSPVSSFFSLISSPSATMTILFSSGLSGVASSVFMLRITDERM